MIMLFRLGNDRVGFGAIGSRGVARGRDHKQTQ